MIPLQRAACLPVLASLVERPARAAMQAGPSRTIMRGRPTQLLRRCVGARMTNQPPPMRRPPVSPYRLAVLGWRRPFAREGERDQRVACKEDKEARHRSPGTGVGAQSGVMHQAVGGETESGCDTHEDEGAAVCRAGRGPTDQRPEADQRCRPGTAETEPPARPPPVDIAVLVSHRLLPLLMPGREAACYEDEKGGSTVVPVGRASEVVEARASRREQLSLRRGRRVRGRRSRL